MTTTLTMATEDLRDFLRQQCAKRGLSLRALSIQAGLSPSTLHNIFGRKYQPSLFSLNRLADHLGVRRQYLWHLAGLLEDMDYSENPTFGDPRLKFQFAQADKLPEPQRTLLVEIIKAVTSYFAQVKTPTNTTPEQ